MILLTAGVTGYFVALAFRARSVARQGWADVRAHPWPLIGLLCGTTGLAIVVTHLATDMLAGPHAADVLFHTHRWMDTTLLVCGFVFTSTDPSRKTSALSRAIYANIQAHPRRFMSAFVIAVASWLLLPLAAVLGVSVPPPVRGIVTILWLLALLVEIGIGYWWWRRGSFVEIADGERVGLVSSVLLHPVFWGWFWAQ